MSSPNTLYSSPEYDGHEADDVVAAVAELAGTWPSNVTIRSVLFWHGPAVYGSPDIIQAGMRNWERLGDALQGTDAVGVEIVDVDDMDASEIEEAYTRVQEQADAWMHQEGELHAGGLIEYTLAGLAIGVTRAGASKMPRLFPIDAYDDIPLMVAAKAEARSAGLTRREHAEQGAQVYPAREAHVIRQAHRVAMELDDGQPHTIAIVQGSWHYPTALALAALGARVEQVVVDPPGNPPDLRAVTAIRQHVPEAELEPILALCEEADIFAGTLLVHGHAERFLTSTNIYDQRREVSDLNELLGQQYMAWREGTLQSAHSELFAGLADAIATGGDIDTAAIALLNALFEKQDTA